MGIPVRLLLLRIPRHRGRLLDIDVLLRCSRWVKAGREAGFPAQSHAVTCFSGFRIDSPGIFSSIR